MPEYQVKVKFIFKGTVNVICKDRLQAHEYIDNHFGCVLTGNNPHTTLSDEEIPDWNFPVHPMKRILSIKKA